MNSKQDKLIREKLSNALTLKDIKQRIDSIIEREGDQQVFVDEDSGGLCYWKKTDENRWQAIQIFYPNELKAHIAGLYEEMPKDIVSLIFN